METNHSLQRFTDAQRTSYATALAEIRGGKKRSHWMWYIFPQIRGLGTSEKAQFYAIQDLAEANQYLQHPELGTRLVEICTALLQLAGSNANDLFGYPDDVKLKSSLTLFAAVPGTDPVFQKVLQKFFGGEKDKLTLAALV